jgi:serine/threonine protein kinase
LITNFFFLPLQSKWRNSDVVVKKIFTETMLTAEQLTEFRAEAELMMRLRPHKNVVQLLGVSMQPDDLCLVIEYLPLGDVLTLLRKEKLSVTAKLRLALGTAAAMAHLHKERVLHRDLATRYAPLASYKFAFDYLNLIRLYKLLLK